MATVNKYLKEAEKLVPKEDLNAEDKLDFLNTQIDGFKKQAYRFQVDLDIAKRYIAVGESKKEDSYVESGEKKIQEAVGHLRSIVINIEVLERLRDELRKETGLSDAGEAVVKG